MTYSRNADLTSSKYKLKVFYMLSFLSVILLIIIRFNLPDPSMVRVVASLIETFIVAILGAVVATLIVRWMTSPSVTMAHMEVVEPVRIAETLEFAHLGSNEWWYRGHLGRHCRSASIPRLARDARNKNISVKVIINILDPTSEDTCRYYADYRRSLKSAKKDEPWTADRVKKELIATIVSAYSWRAEEPLLEIDVSLSLLISLFRVDLSSNLVLITKEDPQEPALRCDAGTFFYNSYREDLRMSRDQSRKLDPSAKTAIRGKITPQDIEQLLVDLGLYSNAMDAKYLSEIRSLVKEAKNPYG